ncbi:hypothetical protein COU57_04670 [Candidatus Pacearchaeota archaeon CG10_big_fil_rev_8_21_14_0_10_32_14]|nr:MAG: hypothetical protein COU57_04670 [Candidatus Pacearchaeota archaeon CG10_big_fil_rev_8_21_14_0_10_32_14]
MTVTTNQHYTERPRVDKDIPLDYQIQSIGSGNEVYQTPQAQRKIMQNPPSRLISLNCKLAEVRSYLQGVEGMTPIKSYSTQTGEQLFQYGAGFVGIHPSFGSITVIGLNKDIISNLEKITLGENK